MGLIFGRPGQSFIDFGMTMATPNPSPEQYRQAAENFKSDASRLALCWYALVSPLPASLLTILPPSLSPNAYFFLKGIGIWFTTYIYMATWALTGERKLHLRRDGTSILPAVRATSQHVFRGIHVSKMSLEAGKTADVSSSPRSHSNGRIGESPCTHA